jgi:hypothetical protein
MDGLWGDESRHVVIETLYSVKTGRGRRRVSRPCLSCDARADY